MEPALYYLLLRFSRWRELHSKLGTTKKEKLCSCAYCSNADCSITHNIISSMAPHEFNVVLRTTTDEFNVIPRSYDVILRNMTWHKVAWHDMSWHNVAWLGNTWHDNTVDNEALVVQPSRDFRATAYKFRAFMSRNKCLGKLENLLNRKVTWIFEVSQTW